MSASSTQDLITGAITDFGAAALVILGAVIVLVVGFLVFKRGIRWLKSAR